MSAHPRHKNTGTWWQCSGWHRQWRPHTRRAASQCSRRLHLRVQVPATQVVSFGPRRERQGAPPPGGIQPGGSSCEGATGTSLSDSDSESDSQRPGQPPGRGLASESVSRLGRSVLPGYPLASAGPARGPGGPDARSLGGARLRLPATVAVTAKCPAAPQPLELPVVLESGPGATVPPRWAAQCYCQSRCTGPGPGPGPAAWH